MLNDISNYISGLTYVDIDNYIQKDDSEASTELHNHISNCVSGNISSYFKNSIDDFYKLDKKDVDRFCNILLSSSKLETSDPDIVGSYNVLCEIYTKLYTYEVNISNSIGYKFDCAKDVITEDKYHFIDMLANFNNNYKDINYCMNYLKHINDQCSNKHKDSSTIKCKKIDIKKVTLGNYYCSPPNSDEYSVDNLNKFKNRLLDPANILNLAKDIESIEVIFKELEKKIRINPKKTVYINKIVKLQQLFFYENVVYLYKFFDILFELIQNIITMVFKKNSITTNISSECLQDNVLLDEYNLSLEAVLDAKLGMLNDDYKEELSIEEQIFSTEKKKNILYRFILKTLTKFGRFHKVILRMIRRLKLHKMLFYRKYLGRIEGLYKNFGDSQVSENDSLLGDPVIILQTKCRNYMNRVINEFINVHNSYSKLTTDIAKSVNMDKTINIINSFITYKTKITKENYKKTKSILKQDMYFKYATILLKDNKPYGYTIKSITEKRKLPPPNHMIVSLFLEKPFLEPVPMAISSIFSSSKSFHIMALEQKKIYIGIINNNRALLKKINVKTIKNVNMKRVDELSKITNDSITSENKKFKTLITKHVHSIWHLFITKQRYIYKMSINYYRMIGRIDKLCRTCIRVMAIAESKVTDKRYKTGFKTKKLHS